MTDSEIRRAIDREHTRLGDLVARQARRIAELEAEVALRVGPTPDNRPDGQACVSPVCQVCGRG